MGKLDSIEQILAQNLRSLVIQGWRSVYTTDELHRFTWGGIEYSADTEVSGDISVKLPETVDAVSVPQTRITAKEEIKTLYIHKAQDIDWDLAFVCATTETSQILHKLEPNTFMLRIGMEQNLYFLENNGIGYYGFRVGSIQTADKQSFDMLNTMLGLNTTVIQLVTEYNGEVLASSAGVNIDLAFELVGFAAHLAEYCYRAESGSKKINSEIAKERIAFYHKEILQKYREGVRSGKYEYKKVTSAAICIEGKDTVVVRNQTAIHLEKKEALKHNCMSMWEVVYDVLEVSGENRAMFDWVQRHSNVYQDVMTQWESKEFEHSIVGAPKGCIEESAYLHTENGEVRFTGGITDVVHRMGYTVKEFTQKYKDNPKRAFVWLEYFHTALNHFGTRNTLNNRKLDVSERRYEIYDMPEKARLKWRELVEQALSDERVSRETLLDGMSVVKSTREFTDNLLKNLGVEEELDTQKLFHCFIQKEIGRIGNLLDRVNSFNRTLSKYWELEIALQYLRGVNFTFEKQQHNIDSKLLQSGSWGRSAFLQELADRFMVRYITCLINGVGDYDASALHVVTLNLLEGNMLRLESADTAWDTIRFNLMIRWENHIENQRENHEMKESLESCMQLDLLEVITNMSKSESTEQIHFDMMQWLRDILDSIKYEKAGYATLDTSRYMSKLDKQ